MSTTAVATTSVCMMESLAQAFHPIEINNPKVRFADQVLVFLTHSPDEYVCTKQLNPQNT
jgi:hypothetical protein